MFRHSQGQQSGTRSVSYFSSEDLPKIPDVIQTYSYTGANQDILVPAGYSSCEYILWGAAGSRAGHQSVWVRGGAGGATTGILAVTGGESLIAIVGEGGLTITEANMSRAVGYGGSGAISSTTTAYPGRGGGRSAIRRSSTELATAGGGGGAGSYSPLVVGGVGGGTTGGGTTGSTGGTQAAGGSSGGGAFQGGNGALYGGSGGGGFFGGGGGSGNSTGNIGGSGGSGFAGGTSALTYQGTGATPPLNTDPRYPGNGVGTSNTTDDQAGHGFIHLRFFV